MALETYQDLVDTDPNEVQDASFAKIAEIYDDGVTLLFDGMEEATQKRYQTNSFVVFKAGDRVRIIKDSGTYVVEYPVGAPKKSFEADYAAVAGTAETASNAEKATYATDAGNANYANSAGRVSTASSLYSSGTVGNTRIWLQYSSGKYYIAAEGQSYKQIYPAQ